MHPVGFGLLDSPRTQDAWGPPRPYDLVGARAPAILYQSLHGDGGAHEDDDDYEYNDDADAADDDDDAPTPQCFLIGHSSGTHL